MALISDALRSAFEQLTGQHIIQVDHLTGGDINEAYLLSTASGKYVLKANTKATAPAMFAAEQKGLQILAATETIAIPSIIGLDKVDNYAFLVLDFIPTGESSILFWENFGQQLAALHQCSHTHFGLAFDNFIGLLPQSNNLKENWIDFYIEERLMPQIRMAIEQQYFSNRHIKEFELLYKRLPNLLPIEAPALIHGDLWSGNFISGPDFTPYLIDPAPAYAHREMDLAMSKLFGGFAPTFYAAYENSFPLQPDFSERLPLYQLYYLLVHLNLFGKSYLPTVLRICAAYQ